MTDRTNGARASSAPWKDDAAEIESAWQALADDLREKRLDETEPYRVELPGFPPVLALRMPIRLLMAKGRIPDTLTPFILALAQRVSDEASAVNATAAAPDEYGNLLNAVWAACVVAPAQIPAIDVPLAAKDALFAWANGVDQAVRSFRRSGNAARNAPDREGVPPGPADVVGDRPADGAVAGVAGPPVRLLRGAAGGTQARGDAADLDSRAGARAEGAHLVNDEQVDLRAGGRQRAAAAGRGRRGARAAAGA